MANPLFQRFVDHTASYNLDIQCAMDGTADAEIVIIGEYPGEKEALFNKPFVGGAGNHLWATLRQFGITRNQCYTTNVIKRRVTTTLKVDHTEIVLWQEALHYELSALKPRVIIALGAVALNALTGIDKITQHRGSVYDYKGIPVVAAYNPAYILRMPQHEIVFAMDMEKVSRVLSGSFTQHVINVTYNPTFEDAVDYLTFLNETNSEFAVDIEAVGGETACIGFATSPNRAFVINFRDAKQNRYTLEEEFVILKKFLIACDNPNTIVIAQNGNFDSYFMGYKDHARFQIDFDTLLAHHTLYPRLPHNLGFLTAQYTDHPYYKDEKDAFHEGGDIEQFWEYNGKDAAITFAVAQKQREELKQQGMYDFFTSHVMRVQKHLALPTIDGIAVDTSRRDEIKSTVTQDVKHARSDFYRAVQIATGNDELYVNPNSAPQLRELFFSKLKLTATRKAVDAKTREGWLKDPRVRSEIRDILIALNRFKTADKFLSTYVEVKLSEQNRFHSEYKQFGVSSAPGRLSSGQSFLGPNNTLIGGNAQNLPHQAYEMFITDDPDVVFIYFDLAQAEARYVGWDANIEQWIEDFERARTTPGFDAHRSLAATMFNMPYEDVPTSDYNDDGTHSIRYIAKRCRHGLNYRMQPPRLAETTGMTHGQAWRNYSLYHNINPELQVWWRTLEKEIKKTRMLFNSYGRRLFITERLDADGVLDSIVAFRPQSTIGDKVQRVWAQCHEDPRWDKHRALIRMNVHDALWGMAEKSFAMTALAIMKEYAEEPIMVKSIVTNDVRPLIIPADCKISDTSNGKTLSMDNMKKVEF